MLDVPESKVIRILSEYSFVIYLLHQGVLDVISKMLHLVMGQSYYMKLDCMVWIPVLTVITLIVSTLLAFLYNKVHFRMFSVRC